MLFHVRFQGGIWNLELSWTFLEKEFPFSRCATVFPGYRGHMDIYVRPKAKEKKWPKGPKVSYFRQKGVMHVTNVTTAKDASWVGQVLSAIFQHFFVFGDVILKIGMHQNHWFSVFMFNIWMFNIGSPCREFQKPFPEADYGSAWGFWGRAGPLSRKSTCLTPRIGHDPVGFGVPLDPLLYPHCTPFLRTPTTARIRVDYTVSIARISGEASPSDRVPRGGRDGSSMSVGFG